ncbi:hypothetical protein PMAYCL1PPCAC_03947, partial [Pristionchus mayeri]
LPRSLDTAAINNLAKAIRAATGSVATTASSTYLTASNVVTGGVYPVRKALVSALKGIAGKAGNTVTITSATDRFISALSAFLISEEVSLEDKSTITSMVLDMLGDATGTVINFKGRVVRPAEQPHL